MRDQSGDAPSDNYTGLVTVLVTTCQSISLADFSNHIIKTTLPSFTNKSSSMRMKTPLISVKYTFCPQLRQFVVEGSFVKLYFRLMIFF